MPKNLKAIVSANLCNFLDNQKGTAVKFTQIAQPPRGFTGTEYGYSVR